MTALRLALARHGCRVSTLYEAYGPAGELLPLLAGRRVGWRVELGALRWPWLSVAWCYRQPHRPAQNERS